MTFKKRPKVLKYKTYIPSILQIVISTKWLLSLPFSTTYTAIREHRLEKIVHWFIKPSVIWISLMHTRNMNYKTNSCMLYINKKIKADTLEEEIIKMLQHLPFPVLLFSFVLIIFSKMYNSKLGILHWREFVSSKCLRSRKYPVVCCHTTIRIVIYLKHK